MRLPRIWQRLFGHLLVAIPVSSLLLAPSGAPLGPTVAIADGFNAEESAVRQLRKATTFSPNGLHHALLLALRDLRDPAMKPLLQSLVQGDHWSLQLDAILGLAEIDESGRVDPWLLGRMKSEQDRADAIRVALELERLDRPDIEALLARDDLQAVARVVLLAELHRLGGTVDVATLQRLAANPDPAIAGLAACLLAELGDGAAAASFSQTLQGLPPAERDGAVEELANAARRYKLKSAIDLLSFRVTDRDERPGPRESVVGMALTLDPKRGVQLWKTALGKSPGVPERVRFGLILLLNATKVPPETFDALLAGSDATGSDEKLLKAMVAAGKALASGRDQAAALIKLYDLGHRRCCRIALGVAEDLDDQGATQVYTHLLDLMADPALRTPEIFNDAIDAASRLASRAPDVLRARLEAADDDGPLQEAILLGLANSRAPAAGELASTVRRIGSGRADSVALVVLARHKDRLSPEDLAQLGRIAGGGGRVDETLQAQAAWLWLRHSGKLDAALPQIVGPVAKPTGATGGGRQ